MILITGSTGQLGRSVIAGLLKKTEPQNIAALTRDETKASDLKALGVNVRVGDYDDTAALERAMRGIETVLLIAGTDEERRLQQHQNVVDAAKRAGVNGLAYTSRALKNPEALANTLMLAHFQTEDLIKASGIPYTIFRNILYMDTVPLYIGEQGLQRGFQLPAGEGRVAYALRSDIGEGIANALITEPCQNKTYLFTNTETYSFADVATALSALTGRDLRYTPIEAAEFQAQMRARGVPAVMSGRLEGFMTDIKHGQEDWTSPDLARLLGRTPTSLHDGLKTLFKIS